MGLFADLPLTAQTAYAQLFEATLAADHFRTVSDLPGSFSTKAVKGRTYWYYQFTEPSGALRQIYVGPDSPEIRNLAEQQKAGKGGRDPVTRMARAAIALGCAPTFDRHLKVIDRLAEYGFFSAGGVLIGTHAFLAYGNMLGVTWSDASRTQDVDFAHAGKSIALALPGNAEVETHSAIESLRMGFLPLVGISGKPGASYLIPREPEFKLDFLTTRHRGGEAVFEHPQLHVPLQPIKFIEFSLEDVQQAVLFSQNGAVSVNVPHPARYALNKLLVYGERRGAFATKSTKDLRQAASLLAFYRESRQDELKESWDDLLSRGRGWVSRAKQGWSALNRGYPELELSDWLPFEPKKFERHKG